MNRTAPPESRRSSRRDLLKAVGGAALSLALPKRLARAAAIDAPELGSVRIGFVAVQSCASLVAAHEKGFFRKHGLQATLAKETSWAVARDKLTSGENHASHVKYAQPVGSTMGVLGSPRTPMLLPFTLARNGSVFMVAKGLERKLTADPLSWKAFAAELRARGETLTIALPLPIGWHALVYRHFLARAGINADRELKLITMPPAQMVQNLRVGAMHACAMVEPWGARGVAEGVTAITMYGHELWPDHPIKALGIMEPFAERHPRTVRAILRALHEAGQWCDDFANRRELARILSAPTYLNAPEATILPGLLGEFDWGDGRRRSERAHAMWFGRRNAPEPREVKWFISQFRRWGMIQGEPDYDGLARRIARPDLHAAALRDLGVSAPSPSDAPIAFSDGTVFDPASAAQFAHSFAVHNLKG